MNKLVERNNIIGGEWIYYKIYSGVESADELLKTVHEMASKLVDSKIIDLWFFIRYADPKQHLRIRFKCTDSMSIGSVISEMHKILNPLVDQDLIWKVQLDTYNREIERYGKNTMEYSEILFYYDSLTIIEYLKHFDDENLRWMFALLAIDNHLDIFNYNLAEKYALLEGLSSGFKNEFMQSKNLNQALNDKYRLYRKDIEKIFNKSYEYSVIYEILENKKKNLEYISEEILSLREKKSLLVDFDELSSSYIHMTMNRIFSADNRKFEMVCYNFLARYYKSKIAYQATV